MLMVRLIGSDTGSIRFDRMDPLAIPNPPVDTWRSLGHNLPRIGRLLGQRLVGRANRNLCLGRLNTALRLGLAY